jgi:ribonuclease E
MDNETPGPEAPTGAEAHGDAERAATAEPEGADAASTEASGDGGATRKRRRGSRGGQRRRKPEHTAGAVAAPGVVEPDGDDAADRDAEPEMPEPLRENRPSVAAAERALVRKPQIGDTRPAPVVPAADSPPTAGRRGRTRAGAPAGATRGAEARRGGDDARRKRTTRATRGRDADEESAADVFDQRRGRERNGRPLGRYLMCVQVRENMAQVAVLEGRNLIEHYVSRPADDISQIHGNIYVGRVQNVLPGMEAAFVDIATPKNAVLYRGDVQYDAEDIEERGDGARIEDILRPRQLIVCQVTKNPIGAKGARLTQEVSLPGRFVVLIPNSKTYGISKRLPDDVRKRLRGILDRVKPAQHGLIVRTAAEHATEEELRADMVLLLDQWEEIAAKAAATKQPTLLYREPELAVRVIREEFNADYRGVVIDDERLHGELKAYIGAFNPDLADRVEYYDHEAEGLSLFEQFHVHEQVHKALDRKVWLPSGGSLIIEHTEALTVIDVNTGKNVGTSSLEETVFHNNMEAADEIAKQLRLRDIGGIIVIDFIDMENRANRATVVERFRNALSRDKTRSQVFEISDLGLVEMTRKRIGEGLLTEFSTICPNCEGRGVIVDHALLD